MLHTDPKWMFWTENKAVQWLFLQHQKLYLNLCIFSFKIQYINVLACWRTKENIFYIVYIEISPSVHYLPLIWDQVVEASSLNRDSQTSLPPANISSSAGWILRPRWDIHIPAVRYTMSSPRWFSLVESVWIIFLRRYQNIFGKNAFVNGSWLDNTHPTWILNMYYNMSFHNCDK